MYARNLMSAVVFGLGASLVPASWAQTEQNGSLVTDDDKGISGDRLRELLDEYIPTDNAHSTLIVLTQCYGGNMVGALSDGRENTAVISATSEGEQAEYGAYDDDAAGGLKPGAGRTSDDVHNDGSADSGDGETPSKAGDAVPLDPVDPDDGPIKSRHILVYAGSPDGGGGTSDEEQLETIENNFAGEANTTVTSVGGDGTGDWDYPATEEGLKDALEEISKMMNENEQFILFVTDHGDQDAADKECTEFSRGSYQWDPLFLWEPVYLHMALEADNVPALTIFVPTDFQPRPCNVRVNDMMFQSVPFQFRVDLNDDGQHGPGDGWEAWIPLPEEMLLRDFQVIGGAEGLPSGLRGVQARLSSGGIAKSGRGSGGGCSANARCSGGESLKATSTVRGCGCQVKAVLKGGVAGQIYAVEMPSGDCVRKAANNRGKVVVKECPSGSGTVRVADCGLSRSVTCP